jgi:hypothetical protein
MTESPTVCSRCAERAALLPSRFHELVPSSGLCRECLAHMYNLSMRAARGAFGPLPIDSSPALQDLMLEMELLRVEAALQQPEVLDREELDRRWHHLLQERMQQRGQASELDLNHIKQWLSRELGSG